MDAISPSGISEANGERISLLVGGQFVSEDSLRAINIRINDRFFRLGDVTTITRGYVDPPLTLFRFKSSRAIGLAIGLKEIFWGPMAYTMMGGIIVGTVLTLLFLPALYVAWFRLK